MKLGELCRVQAGGTPARSKKKYWENGNIPWVKISDFTGKYLSSTEEMITEIGVECSSAKIFPKGTVLYTIFATLGEVCILDIEATTNQAIAGIIIENNSVDREYLYYFLTSLKDQVNRIGRGVAQNNINISILRDIDVPLPEYFEQQKIASILAYTDSLVRKQKEQLELMDKLVKSRFIECFGDMYLNSKGWPEANLESMADVVSGITKGRKTRNEDLTEVPYMAVSNVKDGYIDWTTVKTIEATQQEIEQYRLLPDDVLMTEGGDPDKVGRGAIIKAPLKNCIHQNHIFRVRLDESVLLPEFFAEYLQHQRAKRYFLGCAKQTTGIASINMKQLRALPVLVPPMAEQTAFVSFKAETDNSKLAVQKSLQELETLKKSLMQKYFG